MHVVRIEAWKGYLKDRKRVSNVRFGHGNPEKAKTQMKEELIRQGASPVSFQGVNPNIILRVYHENVPAPVVAGGPLPVTFEGKVRVEAWFGSGTRRKLVLDTTIEDVAPTRAQELVVQELVKPKYGFEYEDFQGNSPKVILRTTVTPLAVA